jgi:PhnB protein
MLTPHLTVNDGEAAIDFYSRAFGATVERKEVEPNGKRVLFAHLQLGESALFLSDDFPEYGGGGSLAPSRLGGVSCTLHLETPDADAAWEQATAAGADVLMPLGNQPWGMRYGQLKDPFGHVWSIGGPVK